MNKLKIGFIPAHRDLMNEEYAIDTKEIILKKLKSLAEVDIVASDRYLTKGGLVRNENDSKKVNELFSKGKLDGIIIGAITYGDEKSVFSIVEDYYELPLFLFAVKDPEVPDNEYFKSAASCGAITISYGLHRRNLKFTFGGIIDLRDSKFNKEFDSFIRVCLAVKKFRRARIGIIGLRPNSFEVSAVNEGLMIEKYRQRIIPINLIDVKYQMEKISNDDDNVKRIINDIVSSSECFYKKKDLVKIAKLELLMLKYAKDYELDAFAIQCWTAIQEYIGLTPCLTNGRVTNLGYPVSCEGDIHGALSMLLQRELTLEKKIPLFLDVLMQHPEEENLFLGWHCGNASVLTKDDDQIARVRSHCPFGSIFGSKSGAATLEFRFKTGIVTINRIVEHNRIFKVLNVVGKMVKRDDKLRGAWSWIEVKDRKKVYETIFDEGFTHHVSVIHEDISKHVMEVCKYLDMKYIQVE